MADREHTNSYSTTPVQCYGVDGDTVVRISVNPDGSVNTVTTLPEGASTSEKQDNLLTELQKKADLTETQPISAESLPLPSGASTESKQDDVISSLASILSKLSSDPSTATKQADILSSLADILAKITNDAATSAKQDDILSSLSDILANVDPQADMDVTISYENGKPTQIVTTGLGKTKTQTLAWTDDQLDSISTVIT